MLLFDVCLLPIYVWSKWRTESHWKTNIGTEVSHVRRDSDTTFKVKVMVTVRFTERGLNASASCSGGSGNVLAVGNNCYVTVCSAAQGALAPTGGGEGRGHIVVAARLQLVST